MLSLGQLYLLIIMYFVGRSDGPGDGVPSRSHFAASATMVKKIARMKSMILVPMKEFSNAFLDTLTLPIEDPSQRSHNSPGKLHTFPCAPKTSTSINGRAPNIYKKVSLTNSKYLPFISKINIKTMRCTFHPTRDMFKHHYNNAKNLTNLHKAPLHTASLHPHLNHPTMTKASAKATSKRAASAKTAPTVKLTSLGRTRSTKKSSKNVATPETEDPTEVPLPQDDHELNKLDSVAVQKEGENKENPSPDTTVDLDQSYDTVESAASSKNLFANEKDATKDAEEPAINETNAEEKDVAHKEPE
eukprot:scaffold60862_cov41-Cyclotella_meneghiniana.AAC.3